MSTAPLARARQLLALATNEGATEQEQRTAAHALAVLLVKEDVAFVPAVSAGETERGVRDHGHERTPPPTGKVRQGGDGVKTADWCVYVAVGMAFCAGCGRIIHQGEAFYTHASIGLRCSGCYKVHGVRIG